MIGLDIQPDAARLVQLKRTKGVTQLVRQAVLPLPTDIFSARKIQQWNELQLLLTEWFDTLGIKNQAVAVSLPVQAVRMQRLTLSSKLSEAEVEAEIFAHLQREMIGINESLNIDFQLFPTPHGDTVDVIFTAVREVYLTNYVECIQAAGLIVKVVDVDCYALTRALGVHNTRYAILHVKKTLTELLIFSERELIFYQHWQTGNEEETAQYLKQNLQLFSSAAGYYVLQQLIICSSSPLDLSRVMTGEVIESQLNVEPDFLVANGLAMWEIPW